jgi:hypothetical protein
MFVTDGSCMNFIAWTTVAPPVAAGAAARAAGAAPPPPPPSVKAVGDALTAGPAATPPLPSYDFLQLLSGKAIETVPAREGTTSEEAPMEIKENMAASGIAEVRRCVPGKED